MNTAEPQVYKNPEGTVNPADNGQTVSASGKMDFKVIFKKKSTILIFGGLIMIIIIELIFGARVLLRQGMKPMVASAKIYPLGEGKMALVSPKKEFKVGEIVPISVKVVTGGKSTDSTDLILKYNPAILEASKSGFIRVGRIYKDYPVADFDQKQGLVKISGTTPPKQEGFVGIGNLATLYFIAKKSGDPALSIEFTKDSTSDSNIVLSSSTKDILTEIKNTDIMINDGVSSNKETKDKIVCPGFYQYCQKSDNLTGKQYCNSGVVENNECIFDPELTVACSVCK